MTGYAQPQAPAYVRALEQASMETCRAASRAHSQAYRARSMGLTRSAAALDALARERSRVSEIAKQTVRQAWADSGCCQRCGNPDNRAGRTLCRDCVQDLSE